VVLAPAVALTELMDGRKLAAEEAETQEKAAGPNDVVRRNENVAARATIR
jgi:hypothetical protein